VRSWHKDEDVRFGTLRDGGDEVQVRLMTRIHRQHYKRRLELSHQAIRLAVVGALGRGVTVPGEGREEVGRAIVPGVSHERDGRLVRFS
jgi:hypothetical protein